jgi:hypothetical protein
VRQAAVREYLFSKIALLARSAVVLVNAMVLVTWSVGRFLDSSSAYRDGRRGDLVANVGLRIPMNWCG